MGCQRNLSTSRASQPAVPGVVALADHHVGDGDLVHVGELCHSRGNLRDLVLLHLETQQHLPAEDAVLARVEGKLMPLDAVSGPAENRLQSPHVKLLAARNLHKLGI